MLGGGIAGGGLGVSFLLWAHKLGGGGFPWSVTPS